MNYNFKKNLKKCCPLSTFNQIISCGFWSAKHYSLKVVAFDPLKQICTKGYIEKPIMQNGLFGHKYQSSDKVSSNLTKIGN